MATIKLNARQNLAYVTDGAGEIPFIQNDNYPTTKSGVTFGRVTTEGSMSWRDRNAANGPNLAGIVSNATIGTPAHIRVDLGSAGAKRIRLAMGDASFAPADALYVQVRDNTTPLLTLTDADGFPVNQYYDAAGTLHTTPAAWTSSNAYVEVTFATTTCIIVLGDATLRGVVTYIEIDDVTSSTNYLRNKLNLLGVGA